MRVHVGSDGWYLCHWTDQTEHEYIEFRGSESLALQWANQFRGDVFAFRTLRRLLGEIFPPLSDEQIARKVAGRLTSGAWVARRRVVKRAAVGGGTRPEEAAAFPKEYRRSATPPQAPSPRPEGPFFPSDIDPVAIADSQKHAAALGLPFCEECLKAQMATK
jgi:hypothetical protein